MRLFRIVAALVVVLVLAGSVASAYPRPGRTYHASLGDDGEPANAFTVYPSISADGRYVAFASGGSNLVPGDTNEMDDAFVRDLETGAIERVSVTDDGSQQDGGSKLTSISGDGRYATFDSSSDALVAGDTNGQSDIFVRDRVAGTTERVSVGAAGQQANAYSGMHDISGDGRFVVFESPATNLVPGDTNGQPDVFVRDLVEGTTVRVSVSSSGAQANNRSHSPTMSHDGTAVVFASYATNLVAGDANGYQDTFVHELETGMTERVSIATGGGEANEYSSYGVASDGGRIVVFGSWASNLVPSDGNLTYDLFVRDRAAGTTERASVGPAGQQPPGGSDWPSITADGRFVAFTTSGGLLPGGSNSFAQVFVRDLVTGAVEAAGLADDGSQPQDHVADGAISADGSAVAFTSASQILAPDAPDQQVFVRERGPAVGVGGIELRPKGDDREVSGWVRFSGGILSAATDPAGDGAAPELGTDLTGASVAYQVEDESLRIRWDLASIPAVEGIAGAPGVVYGFELVAGGVRHEVRAGRAGATQITPASPSFVLYRCEIVCIQVTPIQGSLGTAGTNVQALVELADLGIGDGGALTDLRAFVGPGDAAAGAAAPADELALGNATLPAREVMLGIAPADATEVTFDRTLEISDGRFEDVVATAGLPDGDLRVWVRACLGAECGARSIVLPRG